MQRDCHVVYQRASASVMLDWDVRQDGGVRRCGCGMASQEAPAVLGVFWSCLNRVD